LTLSLAALAFASCDDAGNVADTDGGPFSSIHTDGGGAAGAGVKDAGAGGNGGAGPTDAKVDSGAASGGAGGARDGGVDAAGDGPKGSGGSGATTASGGTTGAGGGAGGMAPPAQTCAECEAASCNKGTTRSAYKNCYSPVDDQGNPAKAAGGPAMGMLKSDLCSAVLSCVRLRRRDDYRRDSHATTSVHASPLHKILHTHKHNINTPSPS